MPPHLAVDLPEHGPSGALGTVLERSRTLCMLQYEREQCREDSFLQAALKLDVVLSGPQLAVFEGEVGLCEVVKLYSECWAA